MNSGGVIAIACEINGTENFLETYLAKISDRLKVVLEESRKNNQTTDFIAKLNAWTRIKNA